MIDEISNINDKAQSMMISMYFAVSWTEPRLVINQSATEWSEERTGPKDVSAKKYVATTESKQSKLAASERVPWNTEVYLVPRVRDLRPGDLRQAAGAEGDVGGEGQEEQDHQLRAKVSCVSHVILLTVSK